MSVPSADPGDPARGRVDLVIRNAGELLTCAGGEGPAIGDDLREIGLIKDGSVVISDAVIEWAGETAEVDRVLSGRTVREELDAAGGVVLPGFVDCHTHIPFARGREAEFRMRVEGKSYLEIARAGGGINSSVKHFRETSTDELVSLNARRLEAMLRAGSTTVECKTGYGLSTEQELRGLEVIAELDRRGPWTLVPTFLGAHSFPPEYAGNKAAYVDLLVNEMIPAVARQGIARYCDVFIEEGVFTVDEARRVLDAARDGGLELKLHVDEFTALGGSGLAAEVGAVTADHLEAITDREMRALAEAGVVGVLMPGVNYFLGSRDYAPARRLVASGVPVALATDFNPGSCMCHSMEMILSLAATQLRLLPEEAIVAATRNAAYACGEGERRGRLQPGFAADILVLDVTDHRTLTYHFGTTHLRAVVAGGVVRNLRD